MGGSATLIHGSIDAKRREAPQGLFGQLLGRGGPKEMAIGADRTLIELPCKDFNVLADDLRAFLRSNLGAPWPSSRAILNYLGMSPPTIYLRGEREGSDTRWYVQVAFSGCAGLAQTSADVAAHWAQRWFEQDRERIDAQLLRPRGFFADRVESAGESTVFLPIGASGYAGFSAEGWDAGDGRRSHYEFDAAIEEADEETARALGAMLETQFVALMQDDQCRCQLCAPDFDRSVLASLPELD